MTVPLKKTFAIASILASSLILVTPAFAAAPDGLGPWADFVVSTNQGLENNGSPVPAVRSDPTAALGVAEQNNVDGTFYSLGFGGSMVLGFDNGISGGSMVFESTTLPYPTETAKVEFSANGTTWVTAGNVSRTGTVAQPRGVACAKYVRITDTSNKALFEPTADGYDVDGVKANGTACNPTPQPTCNSNVTQSNVTSVTTVVDSESNSGKNKSNQNTGGSVSITTGDASSSANINIGGSSNTANGGNCCTGGNTSVTISGNGAGSHNTVDINSGKSKKH